MRFLTNADYDRQIKSDNLQQIISSDQVVLEETEDAAILEIEGYLSRYDIDVIFAQFLDFDLSATFSVGDRIIYTEEEYSDTASYTAGDRVSESGTIYSAIATPTVGPFILAEWTAIIADGLKFYAIEETTGNFPEDDANWTQGDNRNKLLIRHLIDIVVYELHARINPRNVPVIRIDRHDQAIEWLDAVSKGKISTRLPLKVDEDGESVKSIRWGGSPRTTFLY